MNKKLAGYAMMLALCIAMLTGCDSACEECELRETGIIGNLPQSDASAPQSSLAIQPIAEPLGSWQRGQPGSGSGPLLFNYNYDILRVSDSPLFMANGTVNQEVLQNLMLILNDPRLDPTMRAKKAEWPTGMPFEDMPHIAFTSEDFSDFVVPNPSNMSESGAIVIKLFEPIADRAGVANGHLTEFTSQWWQLVYRATDDGSDVLTLWMVQPYRLTPFSGTRYLTLTNRASERHGDRSGDEFRWRTIARNGTNSVHSDMDIYMGRSPSSYYLEANYSAGIIRSNLLRDLDALLYQFNNAEQFLVAPKDLPGAWQTSRFQTGANANLQFYNSGQFYNTTGDFVASTNPNGGLGATGLIWGFRHLHFSLVNGKDGLSIGPVYNHWQHTLITPTHEDLLWIPSDFEIRTMGYDKDNALFQTFLRRPGDPTSDLRWNYSQSPEADGRADITGGRSGLWRLNGFDRGFDSSVIDVPGNEWEAILVWLRTADGLALGSANTVCHAGNRYTNGVSQLAGMRPGVHLSITELLKSAGE